MIFEILTLMVCPLPFYDTYIIILNPKTLGDNHGYYFYMVGDILYLLMFVRLFIVFRCVYNYAIYTNGFSRKICNQYGFASGARFSFKCLFELYPSRTIWGMFIFLILLMSYFMRILEMSYCHDTFEIALYFNRFQQAIWLTVITMTTVGYGDISPNTIGGYIIAMATAFCGAFMISMMVLAVTNLFDMSERQR